MKLWIVATLVLIFVGVAGAQISPQAFGMHSATNNPWPSAVGVQFSSWRSLASWVDWSEINTAPGVYDWTILDNKLAFTQQYGQSVLYTFYRTPSWASTCPTCTCKEGGGSTGYCYPPNDLNADGTGTDQHVKDFITALMQHVGPGKIQYLEIWNEPNISTEYTGTIEQLVRMAKDVRTIAKSFDPNVQMVSPAETGDGPRLQDCLHMGWLATYLAAGGGQYADIIGLHGYVYYPEDVITRLNNTVAVMQQYGQSGKPIFVTEGGWVNYGGQFPPEQQPGFAFRHRLSILSTPAQRFYLFSFNAENEGNLWDSQSATVTPAGKSYQLYYGWLVGATMTQPCQPQSSTSSVWSCTFTRPGGYQAEAIWDAAAPFGQTSLTSVPPQFVQYRDLYGKVYSITNHQVPVGYNPLWLENGL